MRTYLVQSDGMMRMKRTNILFHPKDGWIRIADGRYHVNPARFLRGFYRPFFPSLGFVKREEWVQFWREEHQEPLDMLDQSLKPLPAAIRPSTVGAYVESEVYKRKYQSGLNLWAIVAVLLAFTVLALGFALTGGR